MIAESARKFAIEAHGDQKYGEHPYVYHLDKVAEIVRPWGDELMAIAYLHDVLEDVDLSWLDDIEREFGSMVADCVWCCTDSDAKSRKERKRLSNQEFANAKWSLYPALIVKAADRLANAIECAATGDSKLEMYRAEHTEFRKAAYRPMLCDQIWTALDSILEAK